MNVSDCVPCDPGYYCHQPAQTNTTGLCYGGYYCSGGASAPNPNGNHGNNICMFISIIMLDVTE